MDFVLEGMIFNNQEVMRYLPGYGSYVRLLQYLEIPFLEIPLIEWKKSRQELLKTVILKSSRILRNLAVSQKHIARQKLTRF